jgi:hypothetical protein
MNLFSPFLLIDIKFLLLKILKKVKNNSDKSQTFLRFSKSTLWILM